MATKTKKEVITPQIEEEKLVEEVITPPDEERILGEVEKTKVVKVVDYTAHTRRYKVHNFKKNRTYELNGYEIGAILGMNENAKRELKQGALSVVMHDEKTKEKAYKIEVL